MKRNRIIITAVAAIGLVGVFALPGVRREIFISRAKLRFSGIKTLDEARSLNDGVSAYLWKAPGGQWAIACAESTCCSGAGYNAIVILDSTGKRLVCRPRRSICGGTSGLGMIGIPGTPSPASPAAEWKKCLEDSGYTDAWSDW